MIRRRRDPPRFELLTRPGCHLCEEMEEVLDAVLPRYGLGWEEVDVDSDAVLRQRFGEVIPVLLRDGKPVAKVRIDQRRLERLVQRRR